MKPVFSDIFKAIKADFPSKFSLPQCKKLVTINEKNKNTLFK